MAKLTYKKGDLFANLPDHKVMIPHICNDINEWGSGFVLAVNKYSPIPKMDYHNFMDHMKKCNAYTTLGTTNISRPDDKVMVANMIAQHRHIGVGEKRPIRYVALMECMRKVKLCMNGKYGPKEIYCPKFGSDRARGHWPTIEALIEEIWVDKGIDVTVFEL